MAVSLKYGQIDIPGILEDEPVFIIRGKDKVAVVSINDYANRARNAGAGKELVDTVIESSNFILGWQAANLELVKVPD